MRMQRRMMTRMRPGRQGAWPGRCRGLAVICCLCVIALLPCRHPADEAHRSGAQTLLAWCGSEVHGPVMYGDWTDVDASILLPIPGGADAEAEVSLPTVTVPPFGNTTSNRSPHVSRTWQMIGGVGVNVIWINTAASTVRVLPGFAHNAHPQRGYFPFESFRSFVERYQPRAAINGTYFHLSNGQPTGTLVRFDTYLYQGRHGTAICFDETGDVAFRFPDGTAQSFRGIRHAICTGPTLVKNGALHLRAREEGFSDPAVLGTARRSAIGQTHSGKLVFVTVHTPITLNKLANIMVKLGCRHAANLDGGSSSALYSNGLYVTKPSRALSHVILVYD